jgi:hypothetical protein
MIKGMISARMTSEASFVSEGHLSSQATLKIPRPMRRHLRMVGFILEISCSVLPTPKNGTL